MPQVVSQLVMRGSKEKIYAVIKEMTAYPRFMPNLVSVEVLEQGENTDLTHWVSDVDGRRIVWTERDTFYPEEFRITYAQTEGDLKKMEGSLDPAGCSGRRLRHPDRRF
jgi:coenzyme Q-binding protein COQ10